MKNDEIKVGGMYVAKVTNRLVDVRIDSVHSRKGWNATNTATGKRIHIKSAQRLRGPAKRTAKAEVAEATVANDEKAKTPVKAACLHLPVRARTQTGATHRQATRKAKSKKAGGKQKPQRVSALDAAAQILAKADNPMRARELIAAMAEQGLWKSPAGKTPHATLYAAMTREARDKGTASRFRKVDRGMFAFSKEGTK